MMRYEKRSKWIQTYLIGKPERRSGVPTSDYANVGIANLSLHLPHDEPFMMQQLVTGHM